MPDTDNYHTDTLHQQYCNIVQTCKKLICQLLSKTFKIFTNFSTVMSLRKSSRKHKKLG